MSEDVVVTKINDVNVLGVASATSSHWQTLEEATEADNIGNDLDLDKFKKNTGVRGRYIAGPYQTASDFCFAAAVNLIKANNIETQEIGLLIFVTQFPDYAVPSTACVLHKRLNLSQGCMAFDINLGCSGFVYGLNVAASMLQSSNSKYALVLCGDTSVKDKSRGRNKEKGSHSIMYLFGDGGSAALLKHCSSNQKLMIMSCTDGKGFNLITNIAHSWRHPWSNAERFIDDTEVFSFSINKAPEILNAYMQEQGTVPSDYDALVLHQANKFIMQTVGKRARFPEEKILSSIGTFANTSSASIPNTLVNEYGENESGKELRLLCCGFGVGLSWAAMELNIAPCQILPLIHTDEWFDDGLPEE